MRTGGTAYGRPLGVKRKTSRPCPRADARSRNNGERGWRCGGEKRGSNGAKTANHHRGPKDHLSSKSRGAARGDAPKKGGGRKAAIGRNGGPSQRPRRSGCTLTRRTVLGPGKKKETAVEEQRSCEEQGSEVNSAQEEISWGTKIRRGETFRKDSQAPRASRLCHAAARGPF